jgi:hypothetical protein
MKHQRELHFAPSLRVSSAGSEALNLDAGKLAVLMLPVRMLAASRKISE